MLVLVFSQHRCIPACDSRDREEAKQRKKDKEVLKKMKKVGLPQAIANASEVRQSKHALRSKGCLTCDVCFDFCCCKIVLMK